MFRSRIGIGRITVPTSEDGSKPDAVFQHFFDGLGCLHKFMFSNGQVRYISRHTSDGILKRAKEQGYVTSHMFGANANTPLFLAQDPCSALLGAQVSNIQWSYTSYDSDLPADLGISNPSSCRRVICLQMLPTYLSLREEATTCRPMTTLSVQAHPRIASMKR